VICRGGVSESRPGAGQRCIGTHASTTQIAHADTPASVSRWRWAGERVAQTAVHAAARSAVTPARSISPCDARKSIAKFMTNPDL
jgi:hypothetical protein